MGDHQICIFTQLYIHWHSTKLTAEVKIYCNLLCNTATEPDSVMRTLANPMLPRRISRLLQLKVATSTIHARSSRQRFQTFSVTATHQQLHPKMDGTSAGCLLRSRCSVSRSPRAFSPSSSIRSVCGSNRYIPVVVVERLHTNVLLCYAKQNR